MLITVSLLLVLDVIQSQSPLNFEKFSTSPFKLTCDDASVADLEFLILAGRRSHDSETGGPTTMELGYRRAK